MADVQALSLDVRALSPDVRALRWMCLATYHRRGMGTRVPKRQTAVASRATARPTTTTDRRTLLIGAAALAVLTLALYWPVRTFDFVTYDDLEFVVENPAIATGLSWQNIRWSWANGYWATGGPLTWLSHMVDVQLFGLDAGGHHMTNVLLHVANTVLLFVVMVRLTNQPGASAMVAALFAVHPLHVESVAWISQRKDVLSTLFWLLTMWAYVRYARRPSGLGYAAVTVLFAMGLLSKPMVATLPFTLLLLDFWPLRRMEPPVAMEQPVFRPAVLLLEKLAWIVMSATSLFFTLLSQQHGGSVPGVEQLSLASRLSNAVVSYVAYVVRSAWPVNLTPYYPYDASLPVPLVLACAVVVIAISVAAIRAVRALPALSVGWAWYLGTLVPVIGIVQVGTHASADRFTYVPSIGLFIGIVWTAASWLGRWRVPRTAVAIVALAIVAALGVAARAQIEIWRNGLTLWQHAVRVSPDDARAHLNLGVTLSRARRFADAIAASRDAIRLSPSLPQAHNNLGLALAQVGQQSEAVAAFQEALRLDPDYAAPHANIADLLAAQGVTAEAFAHYERAIQLDSRAGLARMNYAITLAQTGRVDEAIGHARAAVDLDPTRADWRFVMAMLLKEAGRRDEAIRELKAVLSQQPDHLHAGRELTALCGRAC